MDSRSFLTHVRYFQRLVRDVLLTLAGHEFFNSKWSARVLAEWTRLLE